MMMDRQLSIEERTLWALIDALVHIEYDAFTAFDAAKLYKGIQIVVCESEKALEFLKIKVQDLDNLWPGMNEDVIFANQIRYHETVEVCVSPAITEDESFTYTKCGTGDLVLMTE